MFLLLSQSALAGQFAMSVGLAGGGGEVEDGRWSTFAPMTTVSYMTHVWALEGFGGASSSLLMARPDGENNVLVAPMNLEAGLGLGGRAVGGGLLWSMGFTGAGMGLYGHVTLPGVGWVRRWGVEGRIIGYPETATTAMGLMWRVEPGKPDPRRRKGKGAPPQPDQPTTPEQPEEAAPPEPVHHDDPYGEDYDI